MKKIIIAMLALVGWQMYATTPLHIIAPQRLSNNTFTISESGLYVLGGDPVVGFASGAGISIEADNVTLDLNGKSISTSVAGDIAIELPSAFENVTIKNGIISGFHNRGINIATESINILLEDINVTGTSSDSLSFRGFNLEGGGGGSQQITFRRCQSLEGDIGANLSSVDGLTIEDCVFSNNGTGFLVGGSSNITLRGSLFNSNGGNGLSCSSCTNLTIENSVCNANGTSGLSLGGQTNFLMKECVATNNGSNGASFASTSEILNFIDSVFNFNGTRGIQITGASSSGGFVERCQFSSNGEALPNNSRGLDLGSGQAWHIRNSDFSFNSGVQRGDGIQVSGDNYIIEDCTANNNSGSISGRGINLAITNSCIVRGCVTNGNFSSDGNVQGLRMLGMSHLIENCTSNGNVTFSGVLTDEASGFFVDDLVTTSNITISNCTATGNSASGRGRGFFIEAGVHSCVIRNCQAYVNSDVGFFNDLSGAAFLFGNIAAGNPTANYDGSGTFSFVTVTNGTSPPQGSFDERMIDNIEIA